MSEQWSPGLPPPGTVCDVRLSNREFRAVRVEVFADAAGGYLLRGGTQRCGWPSAEWTVSRQPIVVRAEDCEWRPIELPSGF